MKRHDETLLWQYAARELAPDESALIEHHLSECVDCRERLLDVRQARLVLQDAQTPRPRVEWSKVDQGIAQLVEARLLRQAKASRIRWHWPLAFAVVAASVLVAVAMKVDVASVFAKPMELAVAPAPVAPTGTQVEQALGLSRVGAELSMAREGERVAAGEVLRTAVGGRGVLALPDGSRMRLAGGSQLALTRAEADDVALTLERGRVGVQASHRVRRGFVVHTNGMSVRVVGTLFTVSQVAGVVEVAVAEGKVLVEPPEGSPLTLVGGERVRFERGTWKPIRGAATPSQLAELNELTAPPMTEASGAPRVPAGGMMPPGAVARRDDSASRNGAVQQSSQVVGVALTPADPPVQTEGLLPRKPKVARGQATVWPSQAQAVVGAKAEGPAEQQEEVPQLEEKASVWPSMGGGPTTYEPRVSKRPAPRPAAAAPDVAAQQTPAAPIGAYQLEVEGPAVQHAPSEPADFSGWPNGQPPAQQPEPKVWPEPQAPDPEVVPVAKPEVKVELKAAAVPPKVVSAKGKPPAKEKGEPLPEDLEALFLQRAERGLERGICDRYLMGLQEIAGDVSRNERAEKARILRARCYDARVRPDLSEVEYRRYLEVWPRGRHSDEARKAIME